MSRFTRQYTVRGVPDEVDRVLRLRARQQRRSFNELLVAELTAAANVHAPRLDLSDFAGKWIEDPAFDAVLADQRQVDWSRWK